MEKIFSEKNKYQKWLDVELAVVKARMKLGEVPKKTYKKIKVNAKFDVDRIKEIEKQTRHDMLAFIENVNETNFLRAIKSQNILSLLFLFVIYPFVLGVASYLSFRLLEK